MDTAELIREFDAAIRRDPARRGLISSEERCGPLCPGHLAGAAAHLAEHATGVAIVTGFFIPGGDPPAAETDGPPGALVLAQTLLALGIDSRIITDGFCFGALAAGARAAGFPFERLVKYPPSADEPLGPAAAERWRADFWRDAARTELSHLIAIERVGPSHTLESLAAQPRSGPAPGDGFSARVPPEQRDHCHNMRGENIDRYAGDLHRLFIEVPHSAGVVSGAPAPDVPPVGLASLDPPYGLDPSYGFDVPYGRGAPHGRSVTTIGIGDGANEIGMGAVPWEDLERRLGGEQSARVPCRIATDWNIVAGVSNWGGLALAAAVALLRGRVAVLQPFTARAQEQVLEAMVAEGPAVDGVTRRREPTVDGLPLATYLQAWLTIRGKLGLEG